MFRLIFRGITGEISASKRFNKRKSDSSKDKLLNENIAYKTEYFYKQDKELLEMLKQKTQEQVQNMQDEVQTMRNKIDEYNRDINENLRFLKELEDDSAAGDQK